MSANSLPRRIAKQLLAPVLAGDGYKYIQGAAMAWDIRTGAMSEPELDLIGYAVRPGETAIDIGANYGMYCYHLSKVLGPKGKCFAFEALPSTASTLKFILKLMSIRNVELISKGCGDKAGKIDFTVPVQKNGAVSAGQVHMDGRHNERSGSERHFKFDKTKTVSCDVVTIDAYLPDLENVSFLKCDIEGADLLALRGARKTIEKNLPVIVCEINPWFMNGFGLKVEDLVTDFFGSLGYGLYRYTKGKLVPSTVADVEEDNWVFVHPSRKERMSPVLQLC